MKRAKTAATVLAITLAVSMAPALGESYLELVPWEIINSPPPGNSTQHYGWVIDGTTSYHQLGTTDKSRITMVNGFAGVPVASELVSQAQWYAATGEEGLLSFYGFGMSGDYLQFTDTFTDGVWRVHKTSGEIISYVSKDQIMAHTGAGNVLMKSPTKVTPTGEHVFFESEVDCVLITTGPGTVKTLVTAEELIGLQGNSTVNGGLGYDASAALYWGDTTTDSMYKRASDGTLSMALSKDDITAVTGGTAAGFGDIEMGGDSLMYFYESSADGILRFDSSDPAGTLEVYISEDELNAGPAGSDSVYELGWYDGNFAFGINAEKGLYVVPEPTSLALLSLAALAALRRRR